MDYQPTLRAVAEESVYSSMALEAQTAQLPLDEGTLVTMTESSVHRVDGGPWAVLMPSGDVASELENALR